MLMSHNPRHLVSLTLNHLDAILGYVTAPAVQVRQAIHCFVHTTRVTKVRVNKVTRVIRVIRDARVTIVTRIIRIII